MVFSILESWTAVRPIWPSTVRASNVKICLRSHFFFFFFGRDLGRQSTPGKRERKKENPYLLGGNFFAVTSPLGSALKERTGTDQGEARQPLSPCLAEDWSITFLFRLLLWWTLCPGERPWLLLEFRPRLFPRMWANLVSHYISVQVRHRL